ncbi:methylmalonyl Co-A mutase-associated GTPase MeaB [Pararhodonellum marinum]|uniref:methylmalonyl Co-A mutase-associated GTPase MeaB n=1 Tax=Pararhodonellum marinum TaxID=2755358 RepID=UPI00188F62D1|nr:methylmalonyl Co-A mutase-associated GTPase MeaB [Pararhodonellum marinum]
MKEKRKRLEPTTYVKGILDGNRIILSRAITLIESQLEEDQELASKVLEKVLPHSGQSMRIGITGVPGVGKSTFIEQFGKLVLNEGHKLAVLAIDPSSSLTKGSILGDKTRMESLAADERAFIRPSPAGTALGGVGAKTRESMLLCEAAGYDVVFIETVGVGQSETLVKGMVDFFLLLMLAGAGDELQGIKKGIIEMTDALVINKADGENVKAAKKARREYTNALHLFPPNASGWTPKVSVCSALKNEGIVDIWEMILSFQMKMKRNGYFEENRSQQRVAWMHENIRYMLERQFYSNRKIRDQIESVLPEIKSGKTSSIAMARKLLKSYFAEIKN